MEVLISKIILYERIYTENRSQVLYDGCITNYDSSFYLLP